MYTESSTHRAAVITPAGVFYGNGRHHGASINVRHLDGILTSILADRFAPHSTVVLDGVRSEELADRGTDAALRAAGWSFSEVKPWTLFYRDGGARTVALGFRDSMTAPRNMGVLFDADTDPGVLALRLDRYHRLTGYSWRGTFATTSLAAIRLTWENHSGQPRWTLPKIGPAASAVGFLDWERAPTDREIGWGWSHRFDASAAYLGAAIGAELAWSTIEHTGQRPFVKHAAGYWLVQLGPAACEWQADPLRPPLVPPGRVRDGAVWVTTPMAQLLAELDGDLDVIDSYTGRGRPVRILRPWAEQIRNARASTANVPAELVTAVKRTYKDAIGGMQRPGMRIHRPDWAHTVIDLWRATLLRRIRRVHAAQGVWPLAVITDSLVYADATDRPQAVRSTRPWATLTDSLDVAGCELDCGCADRTAGRVTSLGSFVHDATEPLGNRPAQSKSEPRSSGGVGDGEHVVPIARQRSGGGLSHAAR